MRLSLLTRTDVSSHRCSPRPLCPRRLPHASHFGAPEETLTFQGTQAHSDQGKADRRSPTCCCCLVLLQVPCGTHKGVWSHASQHMSPASSPGDTLEPSKRPLSAHAPPEPWSITVNSFLSSSQSRKVCVYNPMEKLLEF